MTQQQIRVASVPENHVYVRHLSLPGETDVVRLPDPRPEGASLIEQWWPPVMLDPRWITEHSSEFDVFHVHFGFDALSADSVRAIVEALHRERKPLVYTVHDLRNPHHLDPRPHAEALDVLVPAADVLLTLTAGAAAEIENRWGRHAFVVPHPHVVEEPALSRPRPARGRPRVGLHLKSLRASMNPVPVLHELLRQAEEHPDVDLVVDVHTDVVTPGLPAHDASVTALLREGERSGRFTLHVHDFYSDDELWDYFQDLDLSILPYRFGTHSGWLEACYDLGTRVLAPDVGYFHDQQAGVMTYRVQDGSPNPHDVSRALDAVSCDAPWRAAPRFRADQRRSIARLHRFVYELVLQRAAPCT